MENGIKDLIIDDCVDGIVNRAIHFFNNSMIDKLMQWNSQLVVLDIIRIHNSEIISRYTRTFDTISKNRDVLFFKNYKKLSINDYFIPFFTTLFF